MDQRSPRRTTALSRKQMQVLRQSLADASDDPQIRAAWGHLTLLTADALGLSVDLIDANDEPGIAALRKTLGAEASNPFYALDLIARLLRQRAPDAGFILGDFLPNWLLARICYQLTGEVPTWIPQKTHHLLPNIPLLIDARGGLRGWELVPVKEWEAVFRVLRDYRRSLQPSRKPGRPRKTDHAPPTKPTRQLDPVLARRAYDMHSDGADWKTIAKSLLHTPETELKQPKLR